MIHSPMLLTLMAMSILIGFGFSGLLVVRAQQREARLLQRRDSLLQRHVRVTRIDTRLFAREAPAEMSLQVRAASWFGVDLERPDICPLPWWLVVVVSGFAAAAACYASGSLIGILPWIGFPFAWMFASRFCFGWFKGKRRKKLLAQFPDALMMIVRAVRVGVPVSEAIHIIAHEQPQPTSDEFGLLADQLAVGEPLEKAMASMAKHADLPEYRFFATALTLQAKAGGALTGTLENLAEMIRKRIAVKERAHALASEARMSIYVLTGLPGVVGGGISILNPEYIAPLITDPLGNKILTAAVISLCLGIATMQTIVKKSIS
jgi:tight adherence protein B